MNRLFLILATAVAAAILPALAETAFAEQPDIFWPMFGANPARDGNSGVEFSHDTIGHLWSTPVPEVSYEYLFGLTGSSACLISVGEEHLVITGSYDRSVYAYDAHTGQEVWRFITGDAVLAMPTFAVVDGEPMLFAASADRTIYALNPLTGRQVDSQGRRLWTHRVYEWTESVMPSMVGHPMVVEIDGRSILFLTIHINDLRPAGSVQESALYAFEAATGQPLWKAPVGSSFATAPALGKVYDEPAVFVVHAAGTVHAFSARDGRPMWEHPFHSEDIVHSGVSYAEIDGHRLLFFGSRLYSIFCISADTGKTVWSRSVGTWIDSTPAIYYGKDGPTLVFGDYEQHIHGLDALTGRGKWKYLSHGFQYASAAIITLSGRPAAIMPCLDNHLYIVSIDDGSFIFRTPLGEFLWSHFQKGEAVWASASAARLGGREIIAIPFYDGRVHVFAHTGQDANVGPPETHFFDALGGGAFAWISGTIIAVVLAVNAVHLVRKKNRKTD